MAAETASETSGGARSIGPKAWLAIGVVSAFIALVLFPPVFGALSVISGVQVYRKYDQWRGLILATTGAVAGITGMLWGMGAI